jgi:hypothetical protein
MAPWLAQEEIDDLCKPLKQAAAQIRFMRSLGLTVRTKPNGAPLVMRANIDSVMGDSAKRSQGKPDGSRGPNREQLLERFNSRRSARSADNTKN